MTARKLAKPKRKPTDPAIKELRRAVRSLIGITDCQRARIEALETRAQFRDASHGAPVSNAAEAVGRPVPPPSRLLREGVIPKRYGEPECPSIWRRFLDFMRTA